MVQGWAIAAFWLRCCESKLSTWTGNWIQWQGSNKLSLQTPQRFFRHYEMNYAEIAQAVVALMAIPEPWVLSIDRTEWQLEIAPSTFWGGAWRGCFPSSMVSTRQTGNSIVLNAWVVQPIPRAFWGSEKLPASQLTEFVGKDWFCYLLSKPLTLFGFAARIISNDGRQSLKVGVVFADLQPGQTKILRHQRCLWGYWLYIAALLRWRFSLVVATTAPTSAITDYAKRWNWDGFRHFKLVVLFGIYSSKRPWAFE